MHDQNQTNHPPDELTQGFWQAWREQVGKTPRLAHLLLQRGRQVLERFQHFYDMLNKLSLAGQLRWQRKLGASLAGVALALALSNAPVAHAFPLSAEAHINGSDCLLVDAITAANTDTATGDCAAGIPGLDTITLLSDVTLYAVNSGSSASVNGLPLITSEITIEGNGFTIARDPGSPNFRILQVAANGDLTLKQTTITGGNLLSGGNGGGIQNSGTLTLHNSTISGNSAGSNNSGGGIYNGFDSALTLTNSTVSGNSAGFAGGIFNLGTATLSNSTVTGNTANSGGGIYNFGTPLTLERSLITGNSASSGNEISNYSGGCLSAASADAPTCLASVDMPPTIEPNLFGHSGETNAQAFSGFTPAASDIVATSDGTTPTALSAILDTTLQVNAPGDTATHALVAGSPAVDAATSGPATDQRGVSRPQGSGFDIGAYELEQASNQPPVVAADNATVTVNEGQLAINDGTVSDPDGDDVSLNASIGVIDNNGNGTWTWILLTSDSISNLPVTVTADDGNGGTAETTFILNVNNVAPTANAGPDQTVYRNASVTVSGSWSDPAGAADNPYNWSWDLDGDAIPDESGSANYGDTIPGSTSFAVAGVATLTFSVTDKDGDTSSDTVDITVVNRAPTANSQSVSTNEDTPLPITLTGADADGDGLVYTVLALPVNGTLSGSAPNLTYTPNPDYFGPDSFTFQVNDELADSSIATVDITVNAVNDPAVALDDSAMTDEDTAVTIPVQGNDSAGPANENQTLSTTAVTDPSNGSAVINPDGSVTYTPDANFNGSDSFEYTVCDAENSCATATVMVLVEMVNDPPVAGDDSVTTPEDTWANFNVLANDSDVDGNLDASSVSVLTSPVHGTLQDNGSGSFTYIPAANFNGEDSFTYQVCDTDGICVDATVTITVTPVNDAPVCTGAAPSVAELWPPNHQFEPVTVNGATDIEGDPITISIYSIYQDEPVDGTGDGDTAPDGDGIGTGTAQVRAERKGNGNGRFYYIAFQASDGNGGSCIATVKVSVPKNQGKKGAAVDDGPLYDSTSPVGNAADQRLNQRFLPLVAQ